MKKIMFIIILLIFSFIGINASASGDYYYVWENTNVDVLVGDAIDNYLLIPKATLYYKGAIKDSNPGMLWGEDETDPDFIDTTKLGKYKLTYRAVSDIEEAVSVIFNVVDTIKPVIKQKTSIKIPASIKPDYNEYFSFTDNYYLPKDLIVNYDDANINYKIPGSYKLYVSVEDLSGNYTSGAFDVLVSVLENPKYKVIDDSFKISYGDKFIVSKYYMAYDAFGVDITSMIEYSEIDTSRIDGTITSKILSAQVVSFLVSDLYGNTTAWAQTFYICDETSPTIELVKDRIEINIGDIDNLDKEYFTNQILELNDNSGISSIDIEYSNVKKAIGEYTVVYTINDYVGNSVTKNLVVSVVCDSIPQIVVKKDIKIKKGSSVNYYNYFTVSDKYDGDITNTADIDDSNVCYSKKGIYFAYITSTNSYGKTSYQTITVRVYEGFFESYYYLILIPVGIIGIVVFFIIKKKKNML